MSKKEKCTCNHEEGACDCHSHDCDCGCECEVDDEIVEITTDDGRNIKLFLIGTIEYKGKYYSAFEPAQEIEGMTEDDVVIFEVGGEDEESTELLPIEDEGLLNEVFEEFCRALEEDELAEEAMSLEPTEDKK